MNELNENEKQPKGDASEEEKSQSKTDFWVAVGACAAGAVMLGLAFIPAIGQYGIIASLICQLIAMTFLNLQKKNCIYFKACKVVRVISYVIFAVGILIIAGAAIYASQQPTA